MELKQFFNESLELLKTSLNAILVLIYGVFISLDIDIDVVKTLMLLIIIDTFLGVAKTVYFQLQNIEKIEFSTKRLLLGMISKPAIIIIPVTLALMGKGLHYDFIVFVETSMDVLIISEGISIFSHLIAIRTKKPVKSFDVITKILIAIRKGLISLFHIIINGIASESKNEK